MVSDSSDSTYGGQDDTYGFDERQNDQASGVTVSGVLDGGPAAKAGLATGDLITRIGSHRLSSAAEVSSVLAKYGVGQKVKITWTGADGDSHTRTITLAASPVA